MNKGKGKCKSENMSIKRRVKFRKTVEIQDKELLRLKLDARMSRKVKMRVR
jgi:hypothetical protein